MLLLALAMADMMSGAAQSTTPVAPQQQAAAPAQPVPTSAPDAEPGPAAGTLSPAAAVSAPAPTGAVDTSLPPASTTPMSVPPAGTDTDQSGYMTPPRDPWVKANRVIFSFDTTLERHLLAPVAHGYVFIIPKFVRFHVTSALYNVEEPLTAANDLLQLRIGSMGKAVFRFIVNSTVGIAGLFDVAKTSGVPIHFSTFGQTLGRYGARPGPYVMLPILGPSDVRDGIGRVVDGLIDPVSFFIGGITSTEGLSLFLLDGVDWRARSDDTLKAVYSATDPYAFVRSAYSQSRAAAVSEATGKQVALPDFDAAPGTP